MLKPLRLHGVVPAIITPFGEDLSIDEAELRAYVGRLIGLRGVTGILCNGYTGEVSALSREERRRIVKVCAEELGGKGFLIAGVDARSTAEAIELARDAKVAGANAIQVNSPFDHLLRRGMASSMEPPMEFFEALDDSVGIPMMIFQYPAWTGISYPTQIMLRLAELDNVVAVKEAVDIDKYVEEYNALKGKVALFADNNGYTLLAMLLLGADGTMVGISNVGTELYVELFESVENGDLNRAVELTNLRLLPLMDVFARDLGRTRTSFVAKVKAALVMTGLLKTAAVRPPELPIGEEDKRTINAALRAAGILHSEVLR